MNLYCFHCAGASVRTYEAWKDKVPGINVIPVEYPGHGEIMDKPLIDNMDDLVQYCQGKIDTDLQTGETVLLGHSLGALVVYEIAKRLPVSRAVEAVFCGCPSPNIFPDYLRNASEMNDEEINDILVAMNGINKEMGNNKIFKEYYLPIIKNDFRIIGNYRPALRALDCNITVINGRQDQVTLARPNLWRMFAKSSFRCMEVDGGHYFIDMEGFEKHLFDLIRCRSR
jgi:surfactin synthase thioesterase subunit